MQAVFACSFPFRLASSPSSSRSLSRAIVRYRYKHLQHSAMSSLSPPIPVVVCGKTEAVGRPMSQLLQPEYEVIHFCQGEEATTAELPHLLAGHDPQATNPNDIGTHDYSRPPRVVMMGRAFSPAQAEAIMKACVGRAKEPVAWIVADPKNTPAPPPAGQGPLPGYAKKTAGEIKAILAAWVDEGGVKDGIMMY